MDLYLQLGDHKYGDPLPMTIAKMNKYFQNLRLKLSDKEDVLCGSASRPEELAGQKVERNTLKHCSSKYQPTPWAKGGEDHF